ncbi:hypothetical protein HK100_008362 [Physocladia obscura]|uniref:Heterokaryon incompatibility domain-containing protein n=1 Tax=Physocladia obscura TaxID=109957 RepID=A0AAD5X6F6_9FUNG|nr:hypothetical protein HK100_008362 [Physocladia obscura]
MQTIKLVVGIAPTATGTTVSLVAASVEAVSHAVLVSHVWSDAIGAGSVPDPDPVHLPLEAEAPSGCASVTHCDAATAFKLRRALRLAAAVGARGVWMDKVCIDQDDVADKSRHIHLMPRLYAACLACLVFGAAFEKCPAANSLHLDGPWLYRVWTLQEAVLPRVLYVNDISSDEFTSLTSWLDSTRANRDRFLASSCVACKSAVRISDFRTDISATSSSKPSADHLKVLGELRRRSCCIEQDKIAGALGMLPKLGPSLENANLYAYSLDQLYQHISAENVKNGDVSLVFARGPRNVSTTYGFQWATTPIDHFSGISGMQAFGLQPTIDNGLLTVSCIKVRFAYEKKKDDSLNNEFEWTFNVVARANLVSKDTVVKTRVLHSSRSLQNAYAIVPSSVSDDDDFSWVMIAGFRKRSSQWISGIFGVRAADTCVPTRHHIVAVGYLVSLTEPTELDEIHDTITFL